MSQMTAHDAEEYAKSYFTQIGKVEPELWMILHKCWRKEEEEEEILNLHL